MKKIRSRALVIFLIAMALSLSGCFFSLRPLYQQQDLVFEPALLGKWVDEEDDISFTFSRGSNNSYGLEYVNEKGEVGRFKAHLLSIDGRYFLDFYPDDVQQIEGLDKVNEFYEWHFLKLHSFAYVEQLGPNLRFAFPDYKWFKDYLEQNPSAIEHELLDREILLTASTEVLQQFWMQHIESDQAFPETVEMTKQR